MTTERNLMQKIQRTLPEGERLRKAPPGDYELGPYYIVDEYSNTLVAWKIDDLDRLDAEIGAD